MPERKFKGWRVDCEEVQGEGAYLALSRPSYAQIRMAQDAGKSDELDNFEVAIQIISMLFVEWNWVDDAGNELPSPKDDPDVIRNLPLQEQNFLVKKFNELNQEDEKN